MNTSSSHARAYRRLGYLAVGQALAVLGLGLSIFLGKIGFENAWLLRLWVALVTLCLLWPVVLALHPGRSALWLAVFVSLIAVLLLPILRPYSGLAPETFGLPMGVSMNPVSAWKYFSAYRAGRAEARKDITAGILAIEEAGLGAGTGSRVRILRERYQIEIKGIAGCIVDEQILGREAGYNSVSRPEIDRRVGRDRVEEAQEEGRKIDMEERAREEQSSKDLANASPAFHSIPRSRSSPSDCGRMDIGRSLLMRKKSSGNWFMQSRNTSVRGFQRTLLRSSYISPPR